MGLQVKLLRVLQERAVTRVGDTKPRADRCPRHLSDASRSADRDPHRALSRGLVLPLNVVPIHLPPLRDRGEGHPDPGALLHAARRGRAGHRSPQLGSTRRTSAARASLAGNIRQLENLIKGPGALGSAGA